MSVFESPAAAENAARGGKTRRVCTRDVASATRGMVALRRARRRKDMTFGDGREARRRTERVLCLRPFQTPPPLVTVQLRGQLLPPPTCTYLLVVNRPLCLVRPIPRSLWLPDLVENLSRSRTGACQKAVNLAIVAAASERGVSVVVLAGMGYFTHTPSSQR